MSEKNTDDEIDLNLELGGLHWELNMLYEQQDELSILIDRKLEVIKELELETGFTVNFDNEPEIYIEDFPREFFSKTIH